MCAQVLVAEDDPKQAELIRRYLELDHHTVLIVHDGRAAIDEARRRRPDLAVLDVMMPKVDGLDVCRVLRAESEMAIVLLTARTTEDDVLLGLDLGADDYVTKPYSPRQLAARVRAILRRSGRETRRERHVLEIGDLVINAERHEVTLAGVLLDCTPAEFRLLEVLAAEPGRVFSRGQLLSQAFGMDRFGTERTIDVHVMNLRRKLEPDPRKPVRLLTVYGVGYKLQDGSADATTA
ncbi:response regulator transcription factor [Saccharopolyspora gloriosae]|uniref:response regulator transcription factor n=1 Tax=Saccharopolyspora gloriosae TaxID=455344 RepID=UPI001FB69C06|nr:response regulator transcription factor [Saccharopolyspora gloriosae]